MVLFYNTLDRALNNDGVGTFHGHDAGHSSVDKRVIGKPCSPSETWIDALLMTGDLGQVADLDLDLSVNALANTLCKRETGSDDIAIAGAKRTAANVDIDGARKRRRSTVTLAAVRDAIEKVTTEPVVKVEEGTDESEATVFDGKPMTKQELLKLQGKLEKNRKFAREARQKKKQYVQSLEETIKTYQERIDSLQQRLTDAELCNAALLRQLARLASAPTYMAPPGSQPQRSMADQQLLPIAAGANSQSVLPGCVEPASARPSWASSASNVVLPMSQLRGWADVSSPRITR